MKIINNNPGSIFDVKLHSDKNNICIYDVYFKSDIDEIKPTAPSVYARGCWLRVLLYTKDILISIS